MVKQSLCVFLIVLFNIFLSSCGVTNTDMNEYDTYIDRIEGAEAFMPSLEELPNYQSIEVFYYVNLGTSINLIVTYSEAEYSLVKETVYSEYVFLENPLPISDHFLIPEVEFEYDGFIISVVDNENFIYPEKFDKTIRAFFNIYYIESIILKYIYCKIICENNLIFNNMNTFY